MKSFFRNSLLFLIPTAALIISCDNDSDDAMGGSEEAMTTEEVKTTMEADQASENIDGMVDFMLVSNLGVSGSAKTTEQAKGWLPDCYEISSVADGESYTVTLDFGEGCETPDGRMLSGKLTMSNVRMMDSTSFEGTSEIVFEDFKVDSVMVNGTKSYTHSFVQDENPYTEVSTDVQMTWDDGTSVMVTSEKKREWLNDVSGDSWNEKAFLVTGTTTVVDREGVTYTAEVETSLRAEFSCRYYVSGVLNLSRDGVTAQVDFGDGTCDNKVTVTNSEGESEEIEL